MHATWLSACQPVPITPERPRARLRQVSCGDSARGARAQLADAVGFDHGQQLGPVGGEERHDEARALGEAPIGLEAGDPELEVGGGHHVQQAFGQAEPEARPVLDRPAGNAGEAALDGLDGVRRREELLDVGFAEIERHGAG